MVKQFGLICVVVVLQYMMSLRANAQQVLDSLIASGQYHSAYEWLEEHDREHQNIDLVLKKVDLALNYYSQSQYHRHFNFVNLRPNEDLLKLRKENPHGLTPYYFPVDTVLMEAIETSKGDFRLHKALADYYNRVYHDFGDRWGEPSKKLLDKSHQYYLEAYKNEVYDYYSLYALGYYETLFQNYFKAQVWFLKSLELQPDEPLTNYNLAVSYLFDGLPQKGIAHANRAVELYVDSLKKGDAARITGILHSKTGDETKALKYFEMANDLSPGYRPNQLYLLRTYLTVDKDEQASDLAFEVFSSALYGPDVPDELLEMYKQLDKNDQLALLFERMIKAYPNDHEACGNVYFHYGKLMCKINKQRARKYFKQSRKHFLEVFDLSHQVFSALNQMLERM